MGCPTPLFALDRLMSDVMAPSERRTNSELRSIFPLVFDALRPYFSSENQWEGQSHEHFAYRTLKEQFPGLTAQDCYIAVAAAKRMFKSGTMPQTAP
jgi:hypothetical protein